MIWGQRIDSGKYAMNQWKRFPWGILLINRFQGQFMKGMRHLLRQSLQRGSQVVPERIADDGFVESAYVGLRLLCCAGVWCLFRLCHPAYWVLPHAACASPCRQSNTVHDSHSSLIAFSPLAIPRRHSAQTLHGIIAVAVAAASVVGASATPA